MAKNRKRSAPRTVKFASGGSVLEELDQGEESERPDGSEEVEVPESELNVGDTTENADGSAEVVLEDEERNIEDVEFSENLADYLPPEVVGNLGREYIDLIEQDIEARKARDTQYAEGIKKSGLTGTDQSDSGGADFDGASRVVHPMLAQAAIEFESRAIKELFPANGPAKTQIIGEQTEAKVDKAERKKSYMNWQATTQVQENRAVYERILSQVPMAGAAYKRWWWDPELKRPRTEAVFLDDIFTPYGASDFYTSPRTTFRQRILREEYERRIRTGLYRDMNLGESAYGASMTDESKAKRASDRVEGVDPDASSYNEDGLRVVYQTEVYLDLEDDQFSIGPAPYILHIDEDSATVLGLYRNWKEDDDKYQKKHHMSEWSFIPWRDGPALGFVHVIGSLSVGATGALRALMDSAHIQNFPGAMKLKGGKTAGTNTQVNATELVEIAAPEGVMDPDIRKLVMPFPFNGPSPVLFNLLEWMTTRAEGVVATASEKIAEGGADMPVGTAMALIEHGSANFRAIHARLHEAMKRDLEIQHRLDSEFMEDEETVEELGELIVYRSDFQGPMDIVPVSDPNIFSEAQRYAQNQAIMQLMQDPRFAPFFKAEQVLSRMLRLMNVPDIEGITNLPKEAKKLSATEENYAASVNERPLKVYPEQDDLLHLKMHVLFSTSPMFGANPMVQGVVLPQMMEHCKEHLMALYKKNIKAAIEAVKTVYTMQGIAVTPDNDDEVALQASAQADQKLAGELAPMIMPGLQQMQQAMQALMEAQKPKASPDIQAQVDGQVKIAEIRAKADADRTTADANTKVTIEKMEMAVQKMTDSSTERLAKLATTVDLIKQQQETGGQQMLQEQAAEQARQLAILQALIAQLAPPEPTDSTGPDGEVIPATPLSPEAQATKAPLMAGIQQVVEQALQKMLAESGPLGAASSSNALAILQQETANNTAALQELLKGLAAARSQVSAQQPV